MASREKSRKQEEIRRTFKTTVAQITLVRVSIYIQELTGMRKMYWAIVIDKSVAA
jgi:hypothetical protein